MSDLQTLHPLVVASFTFDNRSDGHPLEIIVKRYTLAGASSDHASEELTLILTTGIGSSTEVWIPTIKRLYELQSRPNSTIRIGAVWAVESQNQGDAAVLNEHVLKEKYPEHFHLFDYGLAVRSLLSSGLVDTKGSRVIGIGHSAGCGALILAIPETAAIPYHSLILVEPALLHRSVGSALEQMARRNRPLIYKRLDVWPTKTDAIDWMKTRKPWKTWHPEVMQAISDFGLRALPTAEHPNAKGVTPKAWKGQEAASFFSTEDNFKSVDLLGRLCTTIPVHTIWGARKDFLPKKIQDLVTDPKQDRRMASISEIPDAGHWVLQEKPDELSERIFKVLGSLGSNASMAKL